jgi:NAD(P)-dependent dehydrogenase (short-subunit alcohol dehydrogenase family)
MSARYILLTGAAGGIGRATAERVARLGYTVLGTVINDAEAAQLRAARIPNVEPIVMNLQSEDSINAAVEAVRERIGPSGRLAGLANNAGIDHNAPLQTLSSAEIRQMIDVNLTGSLLLTRASLPLLRAAPSRIVFTGSAMGLLAAPLVTTYAATKWAIEGLSDALRIELRPLHIHVALVEPGVVRTPMTAGMPQAAQGMVQRMSPADRAIYEKPLFKIVEVSTKPGAGVPPEKVADAICHALTADKPRTRYRVGADAKAVGFIRHLPDGVRDWLQRTTFGL